MYAIVGATGNTGSVVAETLLARGQQVRVIGRNPDRLTGLVRKGATPLVADVTDAATLTKTFSGAKAVYVMIPPNLSSPDPRGYQERVSDAETKAIDQAGVEYAVMLSSIGADKEDKTGPVIGLHNFERKLNAIGRLKAIYLRAGYFMENILPQVNVIKNFGVVGGPLRPDLAMPMITTDDIGSFAATALFKLNFTGRQARELLGPRDMTYRDVAAVIGKAIGKPDLAYAQLPSQQLKPALVGLGMSPAVAQLLLEMALALNTGHMVALEPRSTSNTTPTTLEQFVEKEFTPAFYAQAAQD